MTTHTGGVPEPAVGGLFYLDKEYAFISEKIEFSALV